MFKPSSEFHNITLDDVEIVSEVGSQRADCSSVLSTNLVVGQGNFPGFGRSSGWSGLKSQIALLHGAYLLLREKVLRVIPELEGKVEDLSATAESQDE